MKFMLQVAFNIHGEMTQESIVIVTVRANPKASKLGSAYLRQNVKNNPKVELKVMRRSRKTSVL